MSDHITDLLTYISFSALTVLVGHKAGWKFYFLDPASPGVTHGKRSVCADLMEDERLVTVWALSACITCVNLGSDYVIAGPRSSCWARHGDVCCLGGIIFVIVCGVIVSAGVGLGASCNSSICHGSVRPPLPAYSAAGGLSGCLHEGGEGDACW